MISSVDEIVSELWLVFNGLILLKENIAIDKLYIVLEIIFNDN